MVVSQKFTLLYIWTQYSYGQTPRIQDNKLGVISPMDLEESWLDAGQFVPKSHAVDSPELQQMTDVHQQFMCYHIKVLLDCGIVWVHSSSGFSWEERCCALRIERPGSKKWCHRWWSNLSDQWASGASGIQWTQECHDQGVYLSHWECGLQSRGP